VSICASLYDQAYLQVKEETELPGQLISEPLTGCLVDINKGVTVCEHLCELCQDCTIQLWIVGRLYVSRIVWVIEEELSKAWDLLRAWH
jgi:hypothetical protein